MHLRCNIFSLELTRQFGISFQGRGKCHSWPIQITYFHAWLINNKLLFLLRVFAKVVHSSTLAIFRCKFELKLSFSKITRNYVEKLFPPEDDQSILIETSSWNQRFFSEPPQLISDSHYMVLPQTFPYCISTMQSFKSYLVIKLLITTQYPVTN